MGTENDIENFIKLQKQKLAQEKATLQPGPSNDQENRNVSVYILHYGDKSSFGVTINNCAFRYQSLLQAF